MRTKNSIKNSITSAISYFINMLLNFISQTIFIKTLGVDYLGLNGVFTNILLILTFFELGFSDAIIYHLYKPIAKKDFNKVREILYLFKKIYLIIFIIMFIISIILIPFLKSIIGTISINVNIYLIYILFFISTLLSLVAIYQGSLIIVNQKKYISNFIHLIYSLVLNILQLIILFKFRNYYLYLIIKIICQILEIIVLYFLSKRLFPHIKEKKYFDVSKDTKKNLFNDTKVLIIHKFSGVVVSYSDNILISMILGVTYVGLYSNYYHLINSVSSLITEVISSISSSVGNFLVLKNRNDSYNLFKKIHFLNFYLATIFGVCLLNVFQPFISIWLGSEYLLSFILMFLLVFYCFLKSLRAAYSIFIATSGVFRKNKISPILEAIVIVVFSVTFMKLFGLIGVVLGSLSSTLIIWLYTNPILLYKNVFNRSYIEYIKETIVYIFEFLSIGIISYILISKIFISNIYLKFLINGFLSFIFTNIVLILIYRKNDNFKFFINLIKNKNNSNS